MTAIAVQKEEDRKAALVESLEMGPGEAALTLGSKGLSTQEASQQSLATTASTTTSQDSQDSQDPSATPAFTYTVTPVTHLKVTFNLVFE